MIGSTMIYMIKSTGTGTTRHLHFVKQNFPGNYPGSEFDAEIQVSKSAHILFFGAGATQITNGSGTLLVSDELGN
jgi:hypothetical protein